MIIFLIALVVIYLLACRFVYDLTVIADPDDIEDEHKSLRLLPGSEKIVIATLWPIFLIVAVVVHFSLISYGLMIALKKRFMGM